MHHMTLGKPTFYSSVPTEPRIRQNILNLTPRLRELPPFASLKLVHDGKYAGANARWRLDIIGRFFPVQRGTVERIESPTPQLTSGKWIRRNKEEVEVILYEFNSLLDGMGYPF